MTEDVGDVGDAGDPGAGAPSAPSDRPTWFEVLERETAYAGFFRIERLKLRHALYGGGRSDVITRELFERGHAAAVLPYDPRADRVVFTEQFRVGALEDPDGPWLLEFVAGVVGEGEQPEGVAGRESVEEIGCPVDALVPIARYFSSPGGTSETLSLFCGRVDSTRVSAVAGRADEHEDIRVRVVGYAEAVALLEAGAVRAAAPIIALQWLMLNRARLRDAWLAR